MPYWTQSQGETTARPFTLRVFGTGTAFSEAVLVPDRSLAIIEGADFVAQGVGPVGCSAIVAVPPYDVWENNQQVGGEGAIYGSYRGGFVVLAGEEIGIQVNADTSLFLCLSIWGTLLENVTNGTFDSAP